MKPSDVRRERLARYIAEGVNLSIAGVKAGFMTYASALRVSEEPGVQARVAELVNEGLSDTVRTAGELDSMLDEMLDADPRLLYDEEGALLPARMLRNAEAMTLTAIKPTMYGTELKFTSKLDVLKVAMQRRGMLIDKKELSGPDGGPISTINAEMSATDAAELYRSML